MFAVTSAIAGSAVALLSAGKGSDILRLSSKNYYHHTLSMRWKVWMKANSRLWPGSKVLLSSNCATRIVD